jgi:hypothetical protein
VPSSQASPPTTMKEYQMKTCTKCGQSRLLSDYNKNKIKKDGLQCICNYCRKEYRLKNKEHIQLKNKEYRLKNKEHIQLKNKEHHKKNARQRIEKASKWNK